MNPDILNKQFFELYRMELYEKGIRIVVSQTLYIELLRKGLAKNFNYTFIHVKHIDDRIVYIEVELPYPNFDETHTSSADNELLKKITKQNHVSFALAQITQTIISHINDINENCEDEVHELALSNNYQLLYIEIIVSNTGSSYNSNYDVLLGLSATALDSLRTLEQATVTDFKKSRKLVLDKYNKLRSCEEEHNDFEFNLWHNKLNIKIPNLAGGAKLQQCITQTGLYSTHNLFSSLEQITMVIAILCFWNDILKPHHQKSTY